MAAARITFRDNRQQQLKVEVTQLVRVCQCVCMVVGCVCVQRHSGVPQNYIYICIHKNETEATQQSQLAPSNNHPSIRSPTPPTNHSTPPYPRASWFLFLLPQLVQLALGVCHIINIIKGQTWVGGGLYFQCLRFDWGNRLSHWKFSEIFELVKAKWTSFVCG